MQVLNSIPYQPMIKIMPKKEVKNNSGIPKPQKNKKHRQLDFLA